MRIYACRRRGGCQIPRTLELQAVGRPGCCELNLGSLVYQEVLLTTQPPLQPHMIRIMFNIHSNQIKLMHWVSESHMKAFLSLYLSSWYSWGKWQVRTNGDELPQLNFLLRSSITEHAAIHVWAQWQVTDSTFCNQQRNLLRSFKDDQPTVSLTACTMP